MLDTPFNPNPFVVTERKGNAITAQRGSKQIIRNVSFFKLLPDDYVDDTETLSDNEDIVVADGNNNPPAVDVVNQPAQVQLRRSARPKVRPTKLKDYV
jgi:hypothetical protein